LRFRGGDVFYDVAAKEADGKSSRIIENHRESLANLGPRDWTSMTKYGTSLFRASTTLLKFTGSVTYSVMWQLSDTLLIEAFSHSPSREAD
jgi:hypothetical protein